MKIIIKNKYNGTIKEFENKEELIMLSSSRAEDIGFTKTQVDRMSINEIIYNIYGDFRRIQWN